VVEIGALVVSKNVDAAVTVLIAGGVACEARRWGPAPAVRSAIPRPADYGAARAKDSSSVPASDMDCWDGGRRAMPQCGHCSQRVRERLGSLVSKFGGSQHKRRKTFHNTTP
jgi:hypothetical protein